jgi:hypothetical protein
MAYYVLNSAATRCRVTEGGEIHAAAAGTAGRRTTPPRDLSRRRSFPGRRPKRWQKRKADVTARQGPSALRIGRPTRPHVDGRGSCCRSASVVMGERRAARCSDAGQPAPIRSENEAARKTRRARAGKGRRPAEPLATAEAVAWWRAGFEGRSIGRTVDTWTSSVGGQQRWRWTALSACVAWPSLLAGRPFGSFCRGSSSSHHHRAPGVWRASVDAGRSRRTGCCTSDSRAGGGRSTWWPWWLGPCPSRSVASPAARGPGRCSRALPPADPDPPLAVDGAACLDRRRDPSAGHAASKPLCHPGPPLSAAAVSARRSPPASSTTAPPSLPLARR